MPIRKAQKYFLSKEGYNCTQAILKAFEGYKQLNADNYASYGYGGSDSGKCGALVGAQILCNAEYSDEIENRFIEKAGSALCREIRKLNKLGCRMCVKEGASLVLEFLSK